MYCHRYASHTRHPLQLLQQLAAAAVAGPAHGCSAAAGSSGGGPHNGSLLAEPLEGAPSWPPITGPSLASLCSPAAWPLRAARAAATARGQMWLCPEDMAVVPAVVGGSGGGSGAGALGPMPPPEPLWLWLGVAPLALYCAWQLLYFLIVQASRAAQHGALQAAGSVRCPQPRPAAPAHAA
jgi:hypothetical protein